jgi:hypothetical protein
MNSRVGNSIRWGTGRLRGMRNSGAARVDKAQIWSIGIYTGESCFALSSPGSVRNPVLEAASVSDAVAVFVADPFMIQCDGFWRLFFEVMNQGSGRGEIGLATSRDGLKWTYDQIVLKEPFHLSYPSVFEWKGEYYMTPESCNAKSVRLYKATDFPRKWEFVCDLLAGDSFSDPSVFRFDDKWWLFTDTAGAPYYAGTLRLFVASELQGPWVEHKKSPLLEGAPHVARPGGRVVTVGNHAIRFAQDCQPVYGLQLRAFEIVELTADSYREIEAPVSPVLGAGIWSWNDFGMHHVDPHLKSDGKWIACVDGFTWKEPGRRAC